MYKIKCLIDGREFSHEFPGIEKKMLTKYIKEKYELTFEEYILKYEYYNISPLCACGCGIKTKFNKGVFFKYFSNHKNNIKQTIKTKNKIKQSKLVNNTLQLRLKRLGINQDLIQKSYNDFCEFKINFTDLEKKLTLDKRTLKKYWLEFDLINDKEVFNRICKKHQYYWQNKNNKAGGRKNIDDEILLNTYLFLKKEKNKYTLKEVIEKFEIDTTELVLYKRLKENFGKEIMDELLRLGISSKPEVEFYNVLKYFFGNDLKKSFRLEGKVYDFILKNKLLIEFDGEYWHSLLKNIDNDKLKDDIAVRNGYKIFRVKDSQSKDIEILNKIKKIAYEN